MLFLGIPPLNGRGRSSIFTFLYSLHLNASSLLRNMMFLALKHMSVLCNMMFLALEHIFTATQHDVSYTRRHVGAMQHDVWGWGLCFWVGWGWGGWDVSVRYTRTHVCATQHDVSCTGTHLHCYATWCFLHWNTCRCYAAWCFYGSVGPEVHYWWGEDNRVLRQPGFYIMLFLSMITEEKSLPMTS